VAALGAELENPELAESFHKCYHQISEQSLLGNLITAINAYIPIRRWLPIEANLRFIRATEEIRTMIRKQIRDRIKQVGSNKNGARTTGKQSRDLLTYMLEERPTDDSAWTEEDIHGHVSPYSCLERCGNCPIRTLITGLYQLLNFVGAGLSFSTPLYVNCSDLT
jgi:hypothetical protein